MLAKDFYRIIQDDKSAVKFLISKNLLHDPKVRPTYCHKCNSKMSLYSRKKRQRDGTMKSYETLRCPKYGCQTYSSIRKPNRFFTYTDLNGKCNSHLSLGQILELVYYWALDIPQTTVVQLTGHSSHTVTDWFNLCRDVCVELFGKRDQFDAGIIEIDECLLRGRRKANKGRLLLGDHGKKAHDAAKRNYGLVLLGLGFLVFVPAEQMALWNVDISLLKNVTPARYFQLLSMRSLRWVQVFIRMNGKRTIHCAKLDSVTRL